MSELEASKIVDADECKTQLNPQDAEFYDKLPNRFSALDPDGEINRYWPRIEGGDNLVRLFGFQDYLYRFTDATNDLEQKYVDNPLVGKEVCHGRWRHAQTQIISDKGGTERNLVQTLRKGWIQTLLASSGSVNFQESRQVKRTSIPLDEEYITIEWPNVDILKAQQIVATELTANVFGNPSIQGVTYSGDWYKIYANIDKNREDGSAVVQMVLAKSQYTVSAYREYATPDARDITYYFQVPKTLVAGILAAEQVEGASAYVSYGNASGLVDITIEKSGDEAQITFTSIQTEEGCLFEEYRTIYLGLSEDDARDVELPQAAQGEVWNLQGPSQGQNGTYNVVVTKRVAMPRTTATATVEDTPFESTKHTDYRHQTAAPSTSGVNFITQWASGFIKRLVNRSHDEFCTHNYTVEVKEAKEHTADEVEVEDDQFQETFLTQKRNLATKPTVVQAVVSGVLYRLLGLSFNEYGRWDVTQQRVVSKDVTLEFSFRVNAQESETHQFWLNKPWTNGSSITNVFDDPGADEQQELRTFNLKPDKTFDAHVVKTIRDMGLGVGGEISYYANHGVDTTEGFIYDQLGAVSFIAKYVSYRSALHTIKQFDNVDDAYDFISTTTNQLQGTNVQKIGKFMYQAEKVVDLGWSVPEIYALIPQ